MTKMLTLIFFTVFLLGAAQPDYNYSNEDCYQLMANNSWCSFGWQRKYINAINCFEEKGDLDEALKVIYKFLFDIDGQINFAESFLNKYVQIIKNKHTRKEIKHELKDVKANVEVDDEYLELFFPDEDLEKISWGNYTWSDYYYPSVEFFGKRLVISSTIESIEADELIFKNYVLKKINKSDLEEYFQKRWLESSLYTALAN